MRFPEYYEFYNPVKINSGKNALSTLEYEMERLKIKKPFILTNEMIDELNMLDLLLEHLQEFDISERHIFKKIPSISSVDVVRKAAEAFRENECDSIIALGGGSVIDTAKGINLMISEGADDIRKLMGVETAHGDMKPLIVIPTTSGTGSEATVEAVITDKERKLKLEFFSNKLLPDLAVLDPRMTFPLPARLTASSGVDALVHAVEAYTGLQKNPLSDNYALTAVKLIGKYLRSAVKEGDNTKYRMAMANASLMAGIAFSNSMVGIIHAIGHACESVSDVSHGDAISILLSHGMEYNLKFDYCRNSYSDLLLSLAGPEIYAAMPAEKRAEAAVEQVVKLLDELKELADIPRNLKEIGIKKEDFEEIVEKAIHDGTVLASAGRVEREDIRSILEAAYE
ncbi:MAG: iron-containing alcohol dehydrogenase [Bacillota bacterium]